ncbi:3-dehydroquinate synthase [Thalassotalea sp. HSM 43]|uniref:3-dehydroquinate synthase n=1 Tax=Thalassotalea sp. HSM 43 TaxID=2552945 RepID=UPI00108057E3|nr:3-dehydroquinate synthase [Thalassotalea sp. HSM 43]QBY04681.1 3-dehydroquinate synthase [Thalassotalea sp. HSM 43]
MSELIVELGSRSYPIFIESGLLTDSPISSYIKGQRVCIVTNDVVDKLYLNALKQQLANYQLDVVILADGEAQKSLANFEKIMAHLLANIHGRDSTLIALGGGVIGDITGFAAACYQRGIDFIQIPTTLLSQVDSSVGGKTAVNHPLGKNMIGAFYQPQAVLIDVDSLNTLPSREFAAGMAEVIKYGILGDYPFFCWLEDNKQNIKQGDQHILASMIAKCCQAKADIVAADEKESGVRAMLNLGHTFGHAIEAEQGYGKWLHGEAVATGMVQASNLAKLLGHLTDADVERIKNLIAYFDLPIAGPSEMNIDSYLKHMARDKKNLAGKIRLIVPTAIGKTEIFDNISREQLQQVI